MGFGGVFGGFRPAFDAGAGGNGLLKNLAAYWTMDEASGTRNDSVGTSHLSVSNTVSAVTGILGNAAFANATALNRLSCASNATLQVGNSNMTLTAWMRWTGIETNPVIVGKDGGSAKGDYRIDVYQSKVRVFMFTANAVAATVTATTFGNITTGVWYFVAMQFDATAGKIYVSINNGAADSADKSGTPAAGTEAFCVLTQPGTSAPNHAVDEVGLWKRVLTPAELTLLYNGGAGLAFSKFTN